MRSRIGSGQFSDVLRFLKDPERGASREALAANLFGVVKLETYWKDGKLYCEGSQYTSASATLTLRNAKFTSWSYHAYPESNVVIIHIDGEKACAVGPWYGWFEMYEG